MSRGHPQVPVRLSISNTSLIVESPIKISGVALKYHGAHVFDQDGKLATVVCEGARGAPQVCHQRTERNSHGDNKIVATGLSMMCIQVI
jgi:hypothetical protein